MKQVLAMGEALIDFIPAQRDCLLKEVESFTRVCGAGKCGCGCGKAWRRKPYGHAAGERCVR